MAGRAGNERCAALSAELDPGSVRCAARRAPARERGPALAAELSPSLVRRSAGGARNGVGHGPTLVSGRGIAQSGAATLPRGERDRRGTAGALAVSCLVAARPGRPAEPALGVLRAPRGRRRRRRRALRAAAARDLARGHRSRARNADGGRHPRRPGVRRRPARDLGVHRGRALRLRRVLRPRPRACYFGVRLLGSLGDFRRARQTVGFALVPLAASLAPDVAAPSRALRRRHVPRRRCRRRGRRGCAARAPARSGRLVARSARHRRPYGSRLELVPRRSPRSRRRSRS